MSLSGVTSAQWTKIGTWWMLTFQICLLFIEESIPFSMRACFKLPNATQNRTET